MPESGNSSFIPKRSPSKKTSVRAGRQVYVLAYVSYIAIFGAVIASGLVFIYKLQLQATLNEQRATLDREVNTFDEADLNLLRRYVTQSDAAVRLLEEHVSILTLLSLIERSTVAPIQFKDLSFQRYGPNKQPAISASILATDFNATIFQRNLLASESWIADLQLESVILLGGNNGASGNGADTGQAAVSFTLGAQLDGSALGRVVNGRTVVPPPPTPPIDIEPSNTSDL